MIDLYLFNTIINTIWYIFTILFLLYRFTSFFSYIYNFVRFCGKLFNGIYYVYDQIRIYLRKRRGYIYLESDDIEAQNKDILLPQQHTKHKTLFEKCKDYFNKQYDYYYFKFFGKRRNLNNITRQDRTTHINLTETTYSSNSINNYSKQSERDLFDKQLSELCANNSSIDFNDYIDQHRDLKHSMENSSLFDINYKTGSSLNMSNKYAKDKDNQIIHDENLFQSVELNTHDNINSTPDPNKSSFLNNYFTKMNSTELDEEEHPLLHNNTYGIEDSNVLLDSSFIKRTQMNKELSNQCITKDNLIIKQDCYPKFVKSQLSTKRNIETITEEDEKDVYLENNKRAKEELKVNENVDKHVFKIGSLWDDDFYTATNDSHISHQQHYGVDINNSSTYLRNNISYSMITNDKIGSDSDEDYANQILKNPYI